MYIYVYDIKRNIKKGLNMLIILPIAIIFLKIIIITLICIINIFKLYLQCG